jgi:hypothetical protein
MCECACGPTPRFKFPGPHGSAYVLQIGAPCPECSTPLGLVITKIKADEMDDPLAEAMLRVPAAKFRRFGVGRELAIPLLDPAKLAEPLAEHFTSEIVDEMNDTIGEREWSEAVAEAMRLTGAEDDE